MSWKVRIPRHREPKRPKIRDHLAHYYPLKKSYKYVLIRLNAEPRFVTRRDICTEQWGLQNKTVCFTSGFDNYIPLVKMKGYSLVLCFIAAAAAMPAAKEDGVMDKFISTLRDCVETDTMLCLKVKWSEVLVNRDVWTWFMSYVIGSLEDQRLMWLGCRWFDLPLDYCCE